MGDHPRAGKPSLYVTSQLGRLSLLSSVAQWNEYQLSGWVIIINGNGGYRLWQPTDELNSHVFYYVRWPCSLLTLRHPYLFFFTLHQGHLAWFEVGSHSAPFYIGKLLQWPCHDDSTTNTDMVSTSVNSCNGLAMMTALQTLIWCKCNASMCFVLY